MTTIDSKETGTATLLRHRVGGEPVTAFGKEKNSIQELKIKDTLTVSRTFNSNENLSKDNREELVR